MTYEESFIKQQLKLIILDLHNRSLTWEQIQCFIDEDIVKEVKNEFDIQKGIEQEQKRLEDRIKFTLTKDHLKLLQRMYVNWQNCEFGSPAIDCKRPYGNSDVEDDIREILNKPKLTDSQCRDIHEDTKFALQIMLQNCSLKIGEYSRKDRYTSEWSFKA